MGPGSDLVVYSLGHCFFCLSHGRSPSSGPGAKSTSGKLHSLLGLSRYLGMDMKKVSEEMEFIPAGADPERSELKAELCQECAITLETFSGLLEQLGIVDEMELTSSLELIQGKLLSGEDTVKYCDLMDSLRDVQDGWRKVDMLRAVRVEAIQKCSQKLTEAQPRVKVGSLTEVPPGTPSPTSVLQTVKESTATEPVEVKEECPSPTPKSEPGDDDECDQGEWTSTRDNSEQEGAGNSPDPLEQREADESNDSGVHGAGEGVKRTSSRSRVPPPIILNEPLAPIPRMYVKVPERSTYKCSLCTKECRQAGDVSLHYRKAHLKVKYQCPVPGCDNKAFTTPSGYRTHHHNVHRDDRSPRSRKYTRVPESGKLRCRLCSREYACPQAFFTHYRLKHRPNLTSADDDDDDDGQERVEYTKDPASGNYVCSVCQRIFTQSSKALAHHKNIHQRGRVKCRECYVTFSSKATLRGHMNTVHTKFGKGVAPPIIPKSEADDEGVDEQAEVKGYNSDGVTPPKAKETSREGVCYQCPVPNCGKEFSTRNGYRFHDKTVHRGLRFMCPSCGTIFTRRETLREHKKTVHLKLKENVCGKCGKAFGSLSNLQFHLKSVHVQSKDFQCHVCGREFQTAVYLRRHVLGVHAKKKASFKCDQCDEAFKRRDQLERHQFSKHPEPSEAGTSSEMT